MVNRAKIGNKVQQKGSYSEPNLRYSHLWKEAACIATLNGWVRQPLIAGCLIIEFAMTQNA